MDYKAEYLKERKRNALLEEKIESLTAEIRALKKSGSSAEKEGPTSGVADIANSSYNEYWQKLEEEEKQRRKEKSKKRKMASSRRGKGNTLGSVVPQAPTTIENLRDSNNSSPAAGARDSPSFGKRIVTSAGDTLSEMNLNESPASMKRGGGVTMKDADSVYSCSGSESSWDSDGSYSSSDWDESGDEGGVTTECRLEEKVSEKKASEKKDAVKKMSSKASDEKTEAKASPASSFSKAPETIFEAPKAAATPTATTFEEVEAQVKKWCQGKTVIDMLGHIPEVYHGAFKGNLGPFAAEKRKPDSEFTYAMIRKAYLKVVRDIHPDKQVKETQMVQHEAKAVFEAVSDAMEKYKKINGIA